MYKKQMLFQKIVCYFALAMGVVVFIYSLGIMTDLYDCLYATMTDPNNHEKTQVPGSIVYYNMQGFNKSFLISAIVMVLSACLLFVLQTSKRRKYYIANYVSTGIYSLVTLFVCIWGHIQIEIYKAQWLAVDFEALAKFAKLWKKTYTESTFWFDIHYVIFGLCLVAVGLLIYNLIWKVQLMKAEEKEGQA